MWLLFDIIKYMKTVSIKEKLVQHFPPGEIFSREDLYAFYRQFEPGLKVSTLSMRICELKKRNIIRSIRVGVYSLFDKRSFAPGIDIRIRGIYNYFKDALSNINYNLWPTGWLVEFSRRQSMLDSINVETERNSTESILFF